MSANEGERMTLRYTILASGSAGNASLIQTSVAGILLDAGLGPQELADRLAMAALSPECVKAMLLTHTHTDHWKDRTLAWLLKRGIPLFCNLGHHAVLGRQSAAFREMLASGLVRSFVPGEDFSPLVGLTCRAIPIRHDSGATFGFRVEGPADLLGRRAAVGYAADLGTWSAPVVEELADVDLLALEFNHDVEMERRSTRPAMLIARVLGDEGHLSNDQAAALVRAVLARSTPDRLRHLVQLHLSRDCNRPELARRAGAAALKQAGAKATVHTAQQHAPGKTLLLDPTAAARPRSPRAAAALKAPPVMRQAWLPGMEA
jgi:ribonuclease BN (tRNA processing enzyme)